MKRQRRREGAAERSPPAVATARPGGDTWLLIVCLLLTGSVSALHLPYYGMRLAPFLEGLLALPRVLLGP